MFMKHYAPNRCLYIKVAKLRTGVGSAEMSHGCWGGGGGVTERRIEVFVKIQKKNGGGEVGVRVDVIEELKFWKNSQKKKSGGGGSVWGGSGWGVRVDVNEELKFL